MSRRRRVVDETDTREAWVSEWNAGTQPRFDGHVGLATFRRGFKSTLGSVRRSVYSTVKSLFLAVVSLSVML